MYAAGPAGGSLSEAHAAHWQGTIQVRNLAASVGASVGKPDGAHRAPAGLGPCQCQRTRRGRAVTTGGLEPPLPRAHQGGLFSSSSSRTQWPAHPAMLDIALKSESRLWPQCDHTTHRRHWHCQIHFHAARLRRILQRHSLPAGANRIDDRSSSSESPLVAADGTGRAPLFARASSLFLSTNSRLQESRDRSTPGRSP
jgi:hypothetical protein